MAALGGVIGALAAACTPEPDSLQPTPRWLQAGQLLVEQREVVRPPTDGANRFLAGWWPWRSEAGVALGGGRRGARLQIVHLAARPRKLVLDLVQAPPDDGWIEADAAGRSLGKIPWKRPLQIPLPADLPLGRVTIELRPLGKPQPPFDVLGARLRPALPAGTLRSDGGLLVQAANSVFEVVREVGPGQRLVGTFEAPSEPRAGQSFALRIEDEGHLRSEFLWSAEGARPKGRQSFDLPAGPAGRIRVQLIAAGLPSPAGAGQEGRWIALDWLPPAAESDRPKPRQRPQIAPPRVVVLYVMDALRADAVSHLGGPPGLSPTYDRVAAGGFTFRQHRSTAPSTLPSTKALFSGRTPVAGHQLGGPDGEHPHLGEDFQRRGYRTALFSGNVFVSAAYGMDAGFDYSAEEVLFEPSPPGATTFNDNAAQVHAAALTWLDGLAAGERAFLYLHTIHPHNPYDPPPDLRRRLVPGGDSSIDGSTDTLLAIRRSAIDVGHNDQTRLRQLYKAAFAYNDRELGRFLDELRQRVADEELFLVLTSDHGEELFEHDGVLHGYTLYEESLRIPLVVFSPGRVTAGSTALATGTLDLHTTLLDLIGAESERGPGRSLLPLLQGTGSGLPPSLHFAAAPTVRGGIFSVQGERFKLVWSGQSATGWGMGEGRGRSRDPEYLFDLAADPAELNNLIGEASLAQAYLRPRLRAWAQSVPGDQTSPPEVELGEELQRRLEALGYL